MTEEEWKDEYNRIRSNYFDACYQCELADKVRDDVFFQLEKHHDLHPSKVADTIGSERE